MTAYIENQTEDHQATTFQDELRKFLKIDQIEYDERYLWGLTQFGSSTFRRTFSTLQMVHSQPQAEA